MENNFTTSVNILRDTERDFQYIPTPNSKRVVSQIVNDFKIGIRSFSIIGTYGTGKSSFLLAFEQSLKGLKKYFEPNFSNNPNIDFIKIIGSYSSLIDRLGEYFDVNSVKNKQEIIFSEIFNKYYSIKGENKVLMLFIDEFGKFLEYASINNPEKEIYFIQQLTEFCNDPQYNIVFVTTIHQSFESYSYSNSLSIAQKQEWIKVKGRFREITFNEPVEQLLFLASEHIGEKSGLRISYEEVKHCRDAVIETKAFNFNQKFLDEIAEKLYPLDILAANVLTLSLQRYGQNERSLFTFLESTDHTGLRKSRSERSNFYNLSNVYDYLNFNFYSLLTSKYNPDLASWSAIRLSLDRVERSFDNYIDDIEKIVKVIGLINLFGADGLILNHATLGNYLKIACGISNAIELLDMLIKEQIIYFRKYKNSFILFEGTDLDIQTALIDAGNRIAEVTDVTTLLNQHFNFSPVNAKVNTFETGTPRYFEYVISEFPISKIPEGEIDGFINLVFNDTIDDSVVQTASSQQKEAILYCFFNNSLEIKNLLFEIEKTKKVLDENRKDKVAKRELDNIIDSQIKLLNHKILYNIFSDRASVKWYFKGNLKAVTNKRDFNKLLSQVCNEVYHFAPTFKNELVNKHKISSSIHTAKKNYLKALAQNWDKENLGFEEDKFPPEKTIYLSLLKENGITPVRKGSITPLSISPSSSFYGLWSVSEKFIQSAKSERKPISDLVDILRLRPFKLKQGVIDFWIPTYLFLRRDDFALFNEVGYIPVLSDENLELISKNSNSFSIKTFDVEGVKLDIFNSYRTFLSQTTTTDFNNASFIETIRPFIVFYKDLPLYAKQTSRLSREALRIRHAIENSREPEETFFEAFPNALGVSLFELKNEANKLQQFTVALQDSIRELRTSYDGLINRFEEFICNEFIGDKVDFAVYKTQLQQRFKKLKKHLLLSNQKTFIQRLDSLLDDKKAWLNSIAQSIIGKTLDSFTDEDEIMLYEKFKDLIFELDSLTNISKIEIDEDKEDVIGVKIDSFFSSINPKIVRVPKSKTEEIEKIKVALKNKLSSDKASNIAAVLNLLKELLQ
jgi:ribosomal protein S15P/S13E